MLILSLFLLVAFCCKKESHKAESFCADGIIHWTGGPAADGMGWTFRWADSSVALNNLPTAFQKDSLPVHLCAEQTNETVSCFCAGPVYYYKVTAIRLR